MSPVWVSPAIAWSSSSASRSRYPRLIVLLRRAFPLRPVLTAVMVGLASAAASACLLEIVHAYNAAATDLLTHALAVALVVVANAIMGGRLLSKA